MREAEIAKAENEVRKRSYVMSRIRKTNSRPELIVRSFLFQKGFRFRLYDKTLAGNPDIILSTIKTVIFVNGCFWHLHKGCKLNRIPKTRTEYWIPKLEGNVKRDKVNRAELRKRGWRVLTIWECQLKTDKRNRALNDLLRRLNAYKNGKAI